MLALFQKTAKISETNQAIKDMRVSLPRNKITQFEFQTFLNFYEDYSEAIKEGNFPF